MESAEAELKSLQNTCRDLIVRTAASHQQNRQQQQPSDCAEENSDDCCNKQDIGTITPSNAINRRSINLQSDAQLNGIRCCASNDNFDKKQTQKAAQENDTSSIDSHVIHLEPVYKSEQGCCKYAAPEGGGGGDDPSDDPHRRYGTDSTGNENNSPAKRTWAWRIARIAVPMQMALFTVFCAACLMQPNCCDNINNFSMSFTPQLRYVRGPPPI